MIPVFISSEGRVLDFTKAPTPDVEVKKEDEPFHIRAAREAAKQSTPIVKGK